MSPMSLPSAARPSTAPTAGSLRSVWLWLLVFSGCGRPLDRTPWVVGQTCDDPRYEEVACVLDGDTFDVGGCGEDVGERIRMLGTAAPEIEHPTNAAECYGDEASEFLRALIDLQVVRLEFDVECTDMYRRTLAWAFLEVDASDALVPVLEELDMISADDQAPYDVLVNQLLIRAGYATVFDAEIAQNVRFADTLKTAEELAQEERRGLWTECDE